MVVACTCDLVWLSQNGSEKFGCCKWLHRLRTNQKGQWTGDKLTQVYWEVVSQNNVRVYASLLRLSSGLWLCSNFPGYKFYMNEKFVRYSETLCWASIAYVSWTHMLLQFCGVIHRNWQNKQQHNAAVLAPMLSDVFVFVTSWVGCWFSWCHRRPNSIANYLFLTCWCQKWQFLMSCKVLFTLRWLWVILFCYHDCCHVINLLIIVWKWH